MADGKFVQADVGSERYLTNISFDCSEEPRKNLLDVPFVPMRMIFDKLDIEDVCRLQSVCKEISSQAEDYLSNPRKWKEKYIERYEIEHLVLYAPHSSGVMMSKKFTEEEAADIEVPEGSNIWRESYIYMVKLLLLLLLIIFSNLLPLLSILPTTLSTRRARWATTKIEPSSSGTRMT